MAVRWTIPFVSFKGKKCRIDIHDNDWNTEAIVLTPNDPNALGCPAADPFYYQEDDSSDLLNDVVRYRTGYIRLIENTYNALSDIYPTTHYDRYVEVFYDGILYFNGYIQLQEFSNELLPGPREINLPVISPLGLFEIRKFQRILPPTNITLGELLDLMLGSENYEKVILPYYLGVNFGMEITSLVISPWNEDYHHSMNLNPAQYVMKPQSFYYLIECICKAFGWICHDTPTALVFTSFDTQSGYGSYPVGHIGESAYFTLESNTSGTIELEQWFTPNDANGNSSMLLPDTGIEINYEGDSGNLAFTFDRMYFNNVVTMPGMDPATAGTRWSLCNLTPVPQLFEVDRVSNATFNADGKVNIGSFVVAWNGYEGVLISFGSYPSGTELFRVRYYIKHVPGLSWRITYETMTDQYSIGGLEPANDIANRLIITQPTFGDEYIEVKFLYNYGGDIQPLDSNYLVFIHNIKFESFINNEPYAEYRILPADKSDIIPSGYPEVSSSITMPISLYRLNNRLIGDSIFQTRLTEYEYLQLPRRQLQQKFLITSEFSSILMPIRLWRYLGVKWRIIASEFHPWDDEYKLTMQHSITLETPPTSNQ